MINIVNFPGLGLSFELNRIAFTLFGHDIYWYGVIIATGFLLAVIYCSSTAHRFGIDSDSIIDMLIFAVPLSIIGARIYYVIFYLDLYRDADGSFNWGEAIAIWDGGLAIYGAIIVAVSTVVVFCKVRKINAWAFLDMGCFGLLIGQLVGRWGNFVNVEAYGGVTDAPWRMSAERIANTLWNKGVLESKEVYQAILDGEFGVHPTFFYESLWNLIGFALLFVIARKWRKVDGQIFLSYVIWYGIGRTIIEGLRTDSLYFFNTGLRSSQIVGVLSAAVALILLLWRLKKAPVATAAISSPRGETENLEQEVSEEHGDQN